MLSAKQGSCEYHFLKSFGMVDADALTTTPSRRLVIVDRIVYCSHTYLSRICTPYQEDQIYSPKDLALLRFQVILTTLSNIVIIA